MKGVFRYDKCKDEIVIFNPRVISLVTRLIEPCPEGIVIVNIENESTAIKKLKSSMRFRSDDFIPKAKKIKI